MVVAKSSAGGKTMSRFIFNRWTQFSIRLILGAIFLYAGFLKFQEPQRFADSIAGFQMVPDSVINLMALSLPVLEMIVGALLVFGIQRRIAALTVLILSGVFAVALITALTRGLKIDCGCFGGGEPSVLKTWLSLGRDLLLGLGAFVIRSSERRECSPVTNEMSSIILKRINPSEPSI